MSEETTTRMMTRLKPIQEETLLLTYWLFIGTYNAHIMHDLFLYP